MKFFLDSAFRFQVGQSVVHEVECSLIAKKEILIVVASLVVHCCAVKKNGIVGSQSYGVADVQFAVE